MSKLISVNIRRHGSDPNKLYINIITDGTTITLNCDHLLVAVEGSLLPPEQPKLEHATKMLTIQETR